METIASGAKKQSLGLAQINSTVAEFDKTTQKNGAMVEDMGAAGTSNGGPPTNTTGYHMLGERAVFELDDVKPVLA